MGDEPGRQAILSRKELAQQEDHGLLQRTALLAGVADRRSNGLKFCAERGLFEAGQGAEVRGLYPHRQSVSIAATSAELQFGCRVHHLPSDASIHRWMLASGCRSRRRISMWMLRAAST